MLQFLTQSTWGERIGWVLVHSLWQFAVVALLAVVLQRALWRRSAAARYWALLAAMIVMVAVPAATWFSPWSGGASRSAARSLTAEMSDIILPSQDGGGGTARGAAATPSPVELAVNPQPEPQRLEPASGGFALSLSLVARHIRPWLPGIVACWFAGVLIAAFRPLLSWYTVRRLRTVGVSPVAGVMRAVLERTAKTLRVARAVEVLQSTLVKTPVVAGCFRPAILLPLSVVTGLPESQLELILAHELAHIRRHDYLVNLLQTLVETLFFYHPAVWWLSRQIRNEREDCCDDVAMATVGNRADYGRALLALEELRAKPTALSVAATGGSLLARIRRIAGCEPAPRVVGGGSISVVILASIATFAAVVWSAAPATEMPERTVAVAEDRIEQSTTEGVAEDEARLGEENHSASVGKNEAGKKPDQAEGKKGDGIAVEGTVTSADGKPCADATVGIYVTRFPGSTFPRTRTDRNGHYRFNVDEPGEYIVAAVAESFVPAWRRTAVGENRQSVDLQLRNGQPIRVRVVDQDGKPMPGVRVSFSVAASDKNAGLIFLDYERDPQKWRRRTDAEGRWSTTWIPDDTIRLSTKREGYLNADVMLAPNESEKVITLERGICVSGRVVDQETGVPIKRFRVTDGWQSNPDDGMIWYHTRPVENENGEYRVCFDMLVSGRGFCIEADGYFPSPVQRIRNDERQKTCNIELLKGEKTTGVVRSPKGTLLAGVDVVLCTSNRGCRLLNGRVLTAPNDYPLTVRTGTDGRFAFPPQDGSCLLLAVHDLGLAQVDGQADTKDITLRPWAKVEGTVTIDGKPGARQRMSLEYANNFGQAQSSRQHPAARIVHIFDLYTDGKGHFAWDRALPGEVKISRKVALSKEDWDGPWTDANSRSVELYSGRTLVVTIEDSDPPMIRERRDDSAELQPMRPRGAARSDRSEGRVEPRVKPAAASAIPQGAPTKAKDDAGASRAPAAAPQDPFAPHPFAPPEAAPPKAKKPNAGLRTVRVRIVGPDGKPVAGTQVSGRAAVRGRQRDAFIDAGRSDADGNAVVELPQEATALHLDFRKPGYLSHLARWEEDRATGRRPLPQDVTIHLIKPNPEQAQAVTEMRNLSTGNSIRVEENDKGRRVIVELAGDRVTDAGLELLRRLPTPDELRVIACNVTDAGLAHLEGLRGLKGLLLVSDKITDVGLAHLEGLRGLKELQLMSPEITDAGLTHLQPLEALEELTLVCSVTDAGMKHLTPLKRLRALIGRRAERDPATHKVFQAITQLPPIEFTDTTLQEVCKVLGDSCGIKVQFDEAAVKSGKISRPVTVNVRGVPLAKTLDLLLHPLRLDWTVRKGALLITTTDTVPRGTPGTTSLQRALPSLKQVDVHW